MCFGTTNTSINRDVDLNVESEEGRKQERYKGAEGDGMGDREAIDATTVKEKNETVFRHFVSHFL